MTLFESVADLDLRIEDVSLRRRERETSSGFDRTTTTFVLSGDGEVGRGEDVTYDTEDHDALVDATPAAFDLAGTYTFAEYSAALEEVELFPTKPPEREASHHYRRWALESAGLDLALRQVDANLAGVLGRDPSPVRFVASTRLTEDESGTPTAARVDTLLAHNPDLEFKLDPTSGWTDELVADLAARDAVRVLDLKGQYHGTVVDQDPDPALYERVLEGFPDAVVEDPALTSETEPLLAEARDRISWDAPITGVESVEALPFEPRWLNIKPSRFGTVESLSATLAHCETEDIATYGGGQFELGVGRSHIQLLASLFYPDAPNDVAPGAYNDPEVVSDLPASPLSPPVGRGLGGGRAAEGSPDS